MIKDLVQSCFDNINSNGICVIGTGDCAREFIAMYQHDYLINGVFSFDNQELDIENYKSKRIDSLVINPLIKIIICDDRYNEIIEHIQKRGCENFGVFDNTYIYLGRQAYMPGSNGINSKQTFYNMCKYEIKTNKKYHIGYVAGVFDLFHIGHLNLLRRAKQMCDYLIVGVVSDKGVTINKKTNLIIPFEERLEIVRSCRYVDEAVEIPYEFCHSSEAFRKYHFDVQFSGSDYENDKSWLSVRDYLRKNGADLVFFPYTKERSTSKIKESLHKIQK